MPHLKNVSDYVDSKTLSYFGFDYEILSFIGMDETKRYNIHLGFHQATNTQVLIGVTTGVRREWFFDSIPNMSNEELRDKRKKEWLNHIENLVHRKNRVSGKKLKEKLDLISQKTSSKDSGEFVAGEGD